MRSRTTAFGPGRLATVLAVAIAAGSAEARWVESAGLRRQLQVVPPAAPGWHDDVTLQWGGLTRYSRYYVPPGLPTRPALVVVLHGGTQSMRKIFGPMAGGTEAWVDVADAHGIIVLAPNGVNPTTSNTAGNNQNWNDCRADAGASQTSADDVGFIVATVRWIDAAIGIDSSRVYATGASNGGGMSYRLAIERPQVFAAVAVFIMNLPADNECGPPYAAVPILICNGTADPLVPWNGGGVAHGKRGSVISAADTLAAWLAADHAGPAPSSSVTFPDLDPSDGCTVRRDVYLPATGGAEVDFYTVTGGGHCMPSVAYPASPLLLRLAGFGKQDHDIEGAQEAWAFLSRQRLAGAR